MRRAPVAAGVGAVVLSVLLLPMQSAVASCAESSGPDGSPIIFVGTAGTERRGFTRFAVDEVLVGPDLAPEVWVLSGQEQPTWPLSLLSAVGSSTDADFVEGERYVVGASRSFATDACSVAAADIGTGHSGAREPVEDGASGADPPMGVLEQTLWAGSLLALVAMVVTFLRRRRRHPGPGVTAST